MPYSMIADLPQAQVRRYSPHQRRAFLAAFNSATTEGKDEGAAFAIAHHAAKQAPRVKVERKGK